MPRGVLTRPRLEACGAGAGRSRSPWVLPDDVRTTVRQLDRLAGRGTEPLRHPLRADVPRRDERDQTGPAEPVPDGGRRLGRVALAPVLVCECPGELRLRVWGDRPDPAHGVVEVEADPADPLAGGGLHDELPGRIRVPAVQPVLHDTARVLLDAAEEVHDARVGE